VDDDPQSAILSVMGRLVGEIPNHQILHHWSTRTPNPVWFRLGLLRPLTDVFVLHDVEPTIINTDIRLFLKHGLSEIAKGAASSRMAGQQINHLDLLSERAAGLFVYAVATLKFLDHGFTSPSKQLDVITQVPREHCSMKGNAKSGQA
jgi:hypothetical protein